MAVKYTCAVQSIMCWTGIKFFCQKDKSSLSHFTDRILTGSGVGCGLREVVVLVEDVVDSPDFSVVDDICSVVESGALVWSNSCALKIKSKIIVQTDTGTFVSNLCR